MVIRVKSSAEFKSVLASMANELVDANIYFKLNQDLDAAHKEFGRAFSQTPGFWSLTMQALMDAAVFRLCKIYDSYPGTISLPNFLETVEQNAGVFSQENFRERLKGNPFVDSLAADVRAPDPTELARHRDYVHPAKNPKVKSLHGLRNNLYAHRSARDAIRAVDIGQQYPLTYADVAELLTEGLRIVNNYSHLFEAATYSARMIGHDDFMHVLRTVREDLERREAAIRAETAGFDPGGDS